MKPSVNTLFIRLKRFSLCSLCVTFIMGFFIAPVYGNSSTADPLQVALIDLIENQPIQNLDASLFANRSFTMDQDLVGLYAQKGMQPLWVDIRGPSSRAQTVATALVDSYKEGLNPEDYFVPAISKFWKSRSSADLALLDILLTQGLKRYLADARYGRSDPCLLDPRLFASARPADYDALDLVQQALQATDLSNFLLQQFPQHIDYRLLRSALAQYRTIAEHDDWPTIPAGPMIKPGSEDRRIPAIRRRLAVTGDYDGSDLESTRYDRNLTAAAEQFQTRHNLKVDGIIGRNTSAEMNIPAHELINRILINLERWRWLPRTLGSRRVLINIAGFYLHFMNDETLELSMPVIVGRVYHKTPVFSDRIRYVEFNPYWNIPNSITKKEILPELYKNPFYLQENHIRLFDGWAENAPEVDPMTLDWSRIGRKIIRYRLRQDPGPDNALGRVKFVFPNRYDVYLHDTPAHELFKQNNRAFSHGCIRLSEPLKFALYLLSQDDNGWTMDRIDRILETKKRTIIVLKKPVPIYILYRTVTVDHATGQVSFFKDVYGRDALLRKALFPKGKPPICRYPPVAGEEDSPH